MNTSWFHFPGGIMISAKHPAIHLHYSDANQKVVIDDVGGKVVTTVAAAIDACKAAGKEQEFWRQFSEMQAKLSAWLVRQKGIIEEAFITVRDSAILFLAVQKSPAFNQDLEDSLTEIDLEIAQDRDLDLIRLNVLAIPRVSRPAVDSLLVCGGSNL